jgi:hypothetical protein
MTAWTERREEDNKLFQKNKSKLKIVFSGYQIGSGLTLHSPALNFNGTQWFRIELFLIIFNDFKGAKDSQNF